MILHAQLQATAKPTVLNVINLETKSSNIFVKHPPLPFLVASLFKLGSAFLLSTITTLNIQNSHYICISQSHQLHGTVLDLVDLNRSDS